MVRADGGCAKLRYNNEAWRINSAFKDVAFEVRNGKWWYHMTL